MKYYNTIDTLPIFNFSKINETEDLRYLVIQSDYFELPKITEKDSKELINIWDKINDEILNYVGFSDEYKTMLRIRKSIALMKVEMITTGDKSNETLIELKEKELLDAMPKIKHELDESIIYIESVLKIPVDVMKCTVKKYFSYIKFISKKTNG
jgi:hypothetical protein